MADKMLSRDELLNVFADGQDPRLDSALLNAIDGLGWAEKAEFSTADVLAVTTRVAADARHTMLTSGHPELAEVGETLGVLLAIAQRQVAKPNAKT